MTQKNGIRTHGRYVHLKDSYRTFSDFKEEHVAYMLIKMFKKVIKHVSNAQEYAYLSLKVTTLT